jgi:hypothetical protein
MCPRPGAVKEREVRRSLQILIGTGGGTPARHVYPVAADLGLPTGVLTSVGAAVAGQNARTLGYLMGRHGVPVVGHEAFGALPLYPHRPPCDPADACRRRVLPPAHHGPPPARRARSRWTPWS